MPEKPQRIVLIGSTQLSLNPRLVKEADALAEAGYEVIVLHQYWNKWGAEMDKELIAQKTWKAILVGGDPDKNKGVYWATRILHKAAKTVAQFAGLSMYIAKLASGRGSFLLVNKACSSPADLYIAHTLAALPAAIKASKKYKAVIGFDVEDFHRNETSNDPGVLDVRVKKFIEEHFFSAVDYFTAASPDIGSAYERLFPGLRFTTILNVFPVNDSAHPLKARTKNVLKLVWFSQTIGLGRGLQDVISALKSLEHLPIQFHIVGYLTASVEAGLNQFIDELGFKTLPEIIFHKPVHPDSLIPFIAEFDIGMAVEPGFPLNNDLLLSNKILTYIAAGLAILATDTAGQERFMNQYPQCGKLYHRGDAVALSALIDHFYTDNDALTAAKESSFRLGQERLNWQVESKSFLDIVRGVLG